MKSFAEFGIESLEFESVFLEHVWDDGAPRVSIMHQYVPMIERHIINKKPFVQPWTNEIVTNKLLTPQEAYALTQNYAVEAKAELNRVLRLSAVGGAKVLTDKKTEKSFIDKAYTRKKGVNIDDVVRGAILCKTEEDLKATIKNLYKNAQIFEHEVKDDKQNEYGYFGSHHLEVRLKSTGVVAEVQVMTKKLWTVKHEAHKVYTKLRSGSDISDDARKTELQHSKELFNHGNRGRDVRAGRNRTKDMK